MFCGVQSIFLRSVVNVLLVTSNFSNGKRVNTIYQQISTSRTSMIGIAFSFIVTIDLFELFSFSVNYRYLKFWYSEAKDSKNEEFR